MSNHIDRIRAWSIARTSPGWIGYETDELHDARLLLADYDAVCSQLAAAQARVAEREGPLRLLLAASHRLSAEAEEYDFDDGMGRGALQDYWDEFEKALDAADEHCAAIDAARTAP